MDNDNNLPDLTNLTLGDTDFNSKTVPQLKALCKLRGLEGYSKQLKAELVQRLNEYTNATVPPPPVPPSLPTTSTLPPPTTSTLPPPTEGELEKYEATLPPPTEEELGVEPEESNGAASPAAASASVPYPHICANKLKKKDKLALINFFLYKSSNGNVTPTQQHKHRKNLR